MFEVREIREGYKGVFATRNIKVGEIIFKEKPFFQLDLSKPMLSWEMMQLNQELDPFVVANEGKEQPEYPAEARKIIERQIELRARDEYPKISANQKVKWMSLHDAHQKIPKDCGPVGIFGLKSDTGKRMNGKIGEVKDYHENTQRYAVKVPKYEELKLIKRQNLKSPGGIFRTNAFRTQGLFETRCRINHSCDPNTSSDPQDLPSIMFAMLEDESDSVEDFIGQLKSVRPDESAVVARRYIAKGEELTCSYIDCNLSTQERTEILQMKYNFLCNCTACTNNVTI